MKFVYYSPFTLAGKKVNASILMLCLLLAFGSASFAQTTNYYWNGGNPSASPAAGGTGSWNSSTKNWRSPNNNSSSATSAPTYTYSPGVLGLLLANTNIAHFDGTAGTVTLGTDNEGQPSVSVTGYTFASGTGIANLNGTCTLGSNVTLNLAPNAGNATGGAISLTAANSSSGFTSSGTANLVLNATQGTASPGNAYAIQMLSDGGTVSVPTNITSATVAGNTNVAGYAVIASNSGSVNGTISGNIINNSTMPTMLGGVGVSNPSLLGGILGGLLDGLLDGLLEGLLGEPVFSGTLTMGGVISGSADLHICSAPGTGTVGGVILNGNNTYTGNTYLDGDGTGTEILQLGISNALPVTTNVVIGYSTTAACGGVLDLNGFNQEVASLSTPASNYAGFVTNSNSSHAAVLTVSGPQSPGAFNLPVKGGLTLVRTGTGTLTLGGANTYTGGTQITGGVVSVNADNNLGGTANITINGGKLATTASFTLGATRTIVLGPTTGTGNNDTISCAAGTTLTYGGKFMNNGGTGGLVKAGAGALVLDPGTASLFTGTLNIAAGTLTLNPSISNFLGSSTSSAPPVVLNGGNLSTNSILLNTSISFNTLTLNDHSAIILDNSNAHSLHFAASSGVSWQNGKKLVIAGWAGPYNGAAGTKGRIYVGTSIGGLSAAQLAQVLFYNGTNYYTATQIANGEIVPLAIYSFTDYYAAAGNANLDATATWSMVTYPNAGTHPTTFTANNQVFHLDNNNTGTINGSNWTVSGTNSVINLDLSTDLSISPTKTITGIINVGAGRLLTINNILSPTFGVLDPSATIQYGATLNNIPDTQTSFPNLRITTDAIIAANTTVNGTLMMSGNINLNGKILTTNGISGTSPTSSFTGSATSGLIINGNTTGSLYFDQTSAATASLGTFTVNGNATLGNNLYLPGGSTPGVVTVGAGSTLNTNGNLILASDTNGTARIGTVSGSIAGNVNIQRFVPGQRGYRLIGQPYTANLTIATLGNYFDITGLAGGNIGSCPSTTPSVYSYTPGSSPAYVGITSAAGIFPAAAAGSLHANGLLTFIRGAQGQGCTQTVAYIPANVTMVTIGAVNTGSVTETVSAGGWNLISNPFPSQVLLSAVSGISGLDNIELVEPGAQFVNAYTNCTGYIPASTGTIIPINGAFLAHNPTGADINLVFTESSKSANAPVNSFKITNTDPTLELSVYNGSALWDSWQMILKPGTGSMAGDNGDVTKFANAQFNISSLSADNVSLYRDARDADSIADGDVVQLAVSSVPQATYTIQATQYTLPTNKTVYLHDKYTNTYVLLNNGVSYPFTVNGDAASQGNNRLELVFNNNNSNTGVGNVANRAGGITIVPNPATSNINVNYSNAYSGAKNISIINVVGQVVKEVATSENAITIPVDGLANGVYLIRTNVNGKSITERFVKD